MVISCKNNIALITICHLNVVKKKMVKFVVFVSLLVGGLVCSRGRRKK